MELGIESTLYNVASQLIVEQHQYRASMISQDDTAAVHRLFREKSEPDYEKVIGSYKGKMAKCPIVVWRVERSKERAKTANTISNVLHTNVATLNARITALEAEISVIKSIITDLQERNTLLSDGYDSHWN